MRFIKIISIFFPLNPTTAHSHNQPWKAMFLRRAHFPAIITIFLSLSLTTHPCLADGNRIAQNQSLSGDQTIVSAGSVFELGFFRPGNSSSYYLGIWYYKVSTRTVVWVGNRETPIFDKSSTELRISGGNLVLFSRFKVPIWSTDATRKTSSSSSLEAVLLDNGNLVLRDSSSAASKDEILWQSFDNPTDTFLPGAKIGRNKITGKYTNLVSWKRMEDPAPGIFSLQIDPNGTNQFVIIWHMSSLYWTSGPWNGRTFSLVPEMRLNYIFNFSFVDNENETYFTYSLYNNSIASRLVMSLDGNIQQTTWLESSRQWALFWSQPRLQCAVQGYCGAFGSCDDQSGQPFCRCVEGFVPKSKDEYNSHVFDGGCIREVDLHCGNSSAGLKSSDEFIPGYAVSFEGSGSQAYESVGNVQQCESICFNSCSCNAYAYEGSRCSVWSGDVFGIYKLSVDSGLPIYIRVAAESPSSGNKRIVFGAVFGSLGMVGVIISFIVFACLRRKRMDKLGSNAESNYKIVNGDEENKTHLTFFSFKNVLAATDNFSESNKLGEGGFGPVYRGNLLPDQEVAIKRLSKKSGQGLEEFMNELRLIAKLQHNYLVRLLGCCVEKEEKILIYEYLPNRSLDKFLFGESSAKAKLDWQKRVKIIEGIAQGLVYIHKYSRLKIIHRDLKASNVLLDSAMNPKISDFGMARIFGINQDEANTNRIVGTYGYMSPEYAFYGQFSEKSDVFSFGVLLLEIVSGRRNTDFYHPEIPFSLVCWAWELWKEGKPEDLIDPATKDTCSSPLEAVKYIHVGLLCVQEAPAERPTMSAVAQMLSSSDAQSFPSPGEPAFITRRPVVVVESDDQVRVNYSNNQLTMSLPTGR